MHALNVSFTIRRPVQLNPMEEKMIVPRHLIGLHLLFHLVWHVSRWTSYASPTSLLFSFLFSFHLETCALPSTIFKSTFQVIFPFDFVPHFDFYLFYFYSFLFFFLFSIGSSFNFFFVYQILSLFLISFSI